MKRLSPGTRAAALALSSLLVLAGCGGGDGDGDAEPDREGTSTPTDAETDEGVEVTEPGTELDFKETAVFEWAPNQNRSGTVSLTVNRIDQGTRADLRAIEVNPRPEAPHLFYVRVTVENTGESDLGGLSPLSLPLYADDGSSVLVRPADLLLEFAPCKLQKLPGKFPQDAKVNLCLVYLLDGRGLAKVALVPDLTRDPITWTGEITRRGPQPKQRPKQQGSQD